MQREGLLSKVSAYVVLVAVALFLLMPLVWMVLVSFHPSNAPVPDFAHLWPKEFHGENYAQVVFNKELPVWRFALNSVTVTAAVVLGQLLVTSMAAFGFARLKFPGRDVLFALFLVAMMFAGTVTQIPVYLMVRGFGWLDTYAALIVPGLSSSFSVFMLRQFFVQIPMELDEAARMDGANEWTVYFRVVLPLAKPALATAAAFCFFAVWTDFFWPLLSTNSVRMRTLEVGLSVFKNSYGQQNWPLQMTAAVVALAPLVVVFLLTQKAFVRGLTVGSIK
ncbi:MAG: carbohydrate ABC transporter permease [Fimbriimonadaceae bacterium]|nr:carbohydrate ABC transporter permease [Fimbriimonadaceae bacterium]